MIVNKAENFVAHVCKDMPKHMVMIWPWLIEFASTATYKFARSSSPRVGDRAP